MISDAHKEIGQIRFDIADIKVGCIAEFDLENGFPVEIIFKESNGSTEPSEEPSTEPVVTDGILIGSYNTGVWTLYETTVMAYTDSAIDKASTYINFYIIGVDQTEGETYSISYLKDVDVATTFGEYDYYIMIYRELESKSYFEGLKVGDTCTITGDITSGSAVLKFN